MLGISVKKIIAALLMMSILTVVMVVGCHNSGSSTGGTTPSQTSGSETSSTSTEVETSSSTSAGTTDTEPTETTTATETTASSETSSEQTTTIESLYRYRVLPANQNIQVDLNDDGKNENLFYKCLDDFSFNLTLNDDTFRGEGEVFLSDWFFLVDLDSGDRYLDIAVQELGPSNDYRVTFLYYNGSRLIRRGIVPGSICDEHSETVSTDPFGTGSIQLDGQGGLIASARGQVLHTWVYDDPWQIGGDQLLSRISRQYYPMYSYDEDLGDEIPETPVKMKMDLPLSGQPGGSDVVAIARSGQDAALIQTDDVEWVQLRTQSGVLGWFRLKDYFMVLIDNQPYFSDDVFEGLHFAD